MRARQTAKRKKKYSKNEVIEAIKGSGAIKTVICQRLGCSRNTLNSYLKQSKCLRKELKNEHESIKDLVESKIYKLIREDNVTMIIFAAKNLLKNRGFSEEHKKEENVKNIAVISEDEMNF